MRVKILTIFLVIILISSYLVLITSPAGAVDEYKFDTNIRVNDDSGAVSQATPDITVADNGNVYIVWSDGRNDNTYWDIYCSKSTDSGRTFGDGLDNNNDVRVDNDQTGARQRDPAIATYDNEIYVVWMDDRAVAHDHIYFAKSTDNGASFGTNVKVDNAPNDAVCEYPDIAVTSDGVICVVWHDDRDGDKNIYYSESTNGGTSFLTDIRVDDTGIDTFEQKYPKIAIGSNGDKYVAWQDDRSGNDDIYFAHASSSTPTTSFDANKRVDDPSAGVVDQTRPTIGAYGASNVYVAWRDMRDTAAGDIYFSKSSDKGSSFSTDKRVDHASSVDPVQDFPELTVNTEGDIYVTWIDKRTSRSAPESGGSSRAINYKIYFCNSTDGGSTFNPDIRVDDSGSITENVEKTTPTIAMRGKNNIYITWQDKRNGNNDIYSTRWGLASEMVGYAPTLTSPSLKEKDLGGQVGGVKDTFKYSVTYTDLENNGPASGYPKLYIYTDMSKSKQFSGSPFTMPVQIDQDGVYHNGEIYVKEIKIGEEGDFAYQIEAKAAEGNLTLVKTDLLSGPKVDDTLPTFTEPTPSPTKWFNTKKVDCSILISDGDGSGVEKFSIAYQTKDNGSEDFGGWHTNIDRVLEGSNYRCSTTVTFGEGEDNYIRWNATDKIGTKYKTYNHSQPYEVKVDTTPVTFSNPDPSPMYIKNAKDQICSITIHDLGGSGVDGSSVKYSYKKAGEFVFNGPYSATAVASGETITVSTSDKVPFENGDENYIKWHVKDLAGNEVISEEFQVKIDITRPPNEPPKPPTWITPSDTRDTTPRIEWGSGSDADNDPLEYFIQIGTIDSGGDILEWISTGSDKFYIVILNLNPQTYYIQVKVFDGLDNSTVFQSTMNITTSGENPPGSPLTIYPDLASDSKPRINWTAPAGSAGQQLFYLIRIGTTSGGDDVLQWYPVGTKLEYNVISPLEDGIYYVQVMAQNDAGTSFPLEETIKIAHFNPELTVMNQVTTKPGGTPTAKITIKNNCTVQDSITINISGELANKQSVTISTTPTSPIIIEANQSRDVTLTIRLPAQIEPRKYTLEIMATSEDGITKSLSHTLVVNVKKADDGGNGGNGGTDDSDAGGIQDFLWIIILIIIIIAVLGIVVGVISKSRRSGKERDEFFGKQDEYEKLYGPRSKPPRSGSGEGGYDDSYDFDQLDKK